MGCYASRAAEEVAALPGVSEVIADKRQMGEVLARRGLVDIPSGISTFARRRRAYVKVQDGCAMRVQLLHHSQRPPGLAQPLSRRRAG